MKAEQYNRLRGQALTILIMDTVRQCQAAGEEISTRQLAKRIAKQQHLHGKAQVEQLYNRVRTTVRNLSDAGMLQLNTTFHRTYRVNVTIITIP